MQLTPPPGWGGADSTFIDQMRDLGTKEITIVPGLTRPDREVSIVEAVVQATKVFVNVDVPLYKGDQLEWDDPRGGRRRVFVTDVKVNDAGGAAASLAHLAVTFTDDEPATRSPERHPRGHTIIVRGSNVNIAVDGSTITQQVPVAQGFEEVVDAVGRALAVIEETDGLDTDEVEAAREAATGIVEEASRPDPDSKSIKKLLPLIRGVLTSAANAGAGAAATGLVSQLFLGG